jgi:hypothetical protein
LAPFAQKRTPAHLDPNHIDKPSATTGRPSEYKAEYCDKVIDAMSQGISLSAFAGTIRVSKETVYAWLSEHRDFSDAVARAKSTRLLKLEQKLLGARYGAQSSAAIFALKNADPHEWRDMRQVTHEHSHTLTAMSDEQLLAIAQGRSDAPMIDVTPSKRKR